MLHLKPHPLIGYSRKTFHVRNSNARVLFCHVTTASMAHGMMFLALCGLASAYSDRGILKLDNT